MKLAELGRGVAKCGACDALLRQNVALAQVVPGLRSAMHAGPIANALAFPA
jgi:hypothetical protein